MQAFVTLNGSCTVVSYRCGGEKNIFYIYSNQRTSGKPWLNAVCSAVKKSIDADERITTEVYHWLVLNDLSDKNLNQC
jgi:hypothetical protein